MPGEEGEHLDRVPLRRLRLLDPNRLLHRLPQQPNPESTSSQKTPPNARKFPIPKLTEISDLSDVRVGAVLGVEVEARDELVARAVGLADAAGTARGVGLVGHPACRGAPGILSQSWIQS